MPCRPQISSTVFKDSKSLPQASSPISTNGPKSSEPDITASTTTSAPAAAKNLARLPTSSSCSSRTPGSCSTAGTKPPTSFRSYRASRSETSEGSEGNRPSGPASTAERPSDEASLRTRSAGIW
jgi:hypothetical protein